MFESCESEMSSRRQSKQTAGGSGETLQEMLELRVEPRHLQLMKRNNFAQHQLRPCLYGEKNFSI